MGKKSQDWTYHGNGIVSKTHRMRDGKTKRIHYVRFQHEGKKYKQQAGTEKQAEQLRDRIDRERREAKFLGRPWEPSSIKVDRAKLADALEQRESEKRDEAAAALIWEAVRDRFDKEHVDEYAKPKDVRQQLNRMGRYFAGRRLDEVTRADVQAYIRDRLDGRGVFSTLKAGAVRSTQREVTFLSRLFNFLRDEEGREIANVAERAWRARRPSNRKGISKKWIGPQKRTPVIPTDEQRTELFRLTREHAAKSPKAWREEADRFAALVALTYFTAARPESESCAIAHGDVSLPDRGKVRTLDGRPALGNVRYGSRTVPLHPLAEEALRSVMDEEADPEACVFPRGDGSPWDRHTYRKRWSKARATLVKRWPELADFRLRDLRNAGETDMRNRGTDPALAAKIAGHSERMSDHYTTVTDAAARDAILSLGCRAGAA